MAQSQGLKIRSLSHFLFYCNINDGDDFKH